MPDATAFLAPEDLRRVGNLQVLARMVVEGFCTGLHRSPHKGFSSEFREHRAYVPGDEIRHLDWKVFGKTDRFYVREYEEETNLRATLLLDASGSMNFGSGSITKLHYATRLAPCLAYLMLRQADGVGLVTFDQTVRSFLPPRARPSHFQRIAETLTALQGGGETDPAAVFREVIPKMNRRGLQILISDCFGDPEQLVQALAHLRHARHEVIVFQIWDRAELDFPFQNWTRFECLEHSDVHQLVDPAQLRRTYLDNLRHFRETLVAGCHRHKIDLVPMVTDEPYAEGLARYLAHRLRRA